jgi:hypothetical protein
MRMTADRCISGLSATSGHLGNSAVGQLKALVACWAGQQRGRGPDVHGFEAGAIVRAHGEVHSCRIDTLRISLSPVAA